MGIATDVIKQLTAERDQWKARAESLERAIKAKAACVTCKKKPRNGYCDDINVCIIEDLSFPHWELDEARFAAIAPEAEETTCRQ